MQGWIRALWAQTCGYCAKPIAKDDPMLEIRIGPLVFRRCRWCAEARGHGLPPDDLPPSRPDWKALQSGEKP
jgi:hypothetical protein